MRTKIVMLLAVLLFSVFLPQPPANAGGVDRHIFDGHVGSIAKNLSSNSPTFINRNATQQSCFYDLLIELDHLSLARLNTIVENLPLEWSDCHRPKSSADIG